MSQTSETPPKPGTELVRRPEAALVKRSPAAEAELRAHLAREARIERGAKARLAPFAAAAVVAVLGWAGWGLHELLRLGAGPAAAVLALPVAMSLVVLAGAAAAVAWRRQLAGHRGRLALATAAAATWAGVVSMVSPMSWTATAVLVLGAIALCSRWQAAHAVAQPDPADATRTPVQATARDRRQDNDDAAEVAEVIERWDSRIAVARGAVPGSALIDAQVLPAAIRFTVETEPGTTSFDTVHAVRGRIASGLQRPGSRVVLEPSDRSESEFSLTVITRDLLAEGVAYTGPNYQSGQIRIGEFADGAGDAVFVAADKVGARNGLATGEPGSGKSAFLEAVGMGLLASGHWHLMFGDGDPEGGSSPLLNQISDWAAAGPEQVLAQLAALESMLEVRSMLKATLTIGPDGLPVERTDPSQPSAREIHPCQAFPGVMWILDELHRLAGDPMMRDAKFIARLERLSRILRKYGGGLLVGTQSMLLPDFGGSSPLRGYLSSRNLFAFRNHNKSERAVVSGLEISPSLLPPGGGYAFSAGAGRLAMLRVAWSPDMARHAENLSSAILDQDSELAMAPHRPALVDDDTAFEEKLARLRAWRSGAGTRPSAELTPTEPAARGVDVFGDPTALAVPAALTGDNVVPLTPRQALPALDALPADEDALPTTQRAVLGAVRDGHNATGAIAKAMGFSSSNTSKALSALVDLGLLDKAEHGLYYPAATPAGTSR
ncbi:hypothetical protein [Pseudonocardia sp. HH130630-07]|uniref:hypothetical protein n=1 Tax=Pseudonocardia sp. HH130630-07 TaxID=1690815 RepID=UPI000814D663|nr:hypothetical protein [Pseudonocardia sp. HH130630-07]ANY10631.1 hypothetical protein AFB00_29945 [Pseudonocardia sp. HH130630-07]